MLTWDEMGRSGWVRNVVSLSFIGLFSIGCGVVSFGDDAQSDSGAVSDGPLDARVPDPVDVGAIDAGAVDAGAVDAGDCRPIEGWPIPMPQGWPFGSTEESWSAMVFNWADQLGTPAAVSRCTLAACHGGDSPADAKQPYMGSTAARYAEAIASFYPYVRDESAFVPTYSGKLWKHHENFAGDRGDARTPTFTEEETAFLMELVRKAFSCAAAPVLEPQDAGPACGTPENLCFCPPPSELPQLDTTSCQ